MITFEWDDLIQWDGSAQWGPPSPTVEFKVFTRGGAYLTNLPDAQGRQWQDVLNDTGTGAVTVGLSDPDLAHLAEGNIVRCYLDGMVAFSWVVGPMDQSTVSAEEEAGEERRIVGRGTLGLWADAVVYPETSGSGITFLPLSQRKATDTRRFDFAAAGYDDSSWLGALVVPPPPALEPLDGTPSGWPLESQEWIWTRTRDGGNNHPSGECYFRHTFTVVSNTEATIYITADNGCELYLDGEMLLSDMRTPFLWAQSRSVNLTLTSGTHLLAVKGLNHFAPSAPVNPAGIALVVVRLDDEGEAEAVLTSTGQGWRGVDYPAEPPGMTVGLILTKLFQEAQARGALSGLSLGFSTTHDSAGAPWPNAPDVTMPVGTNYLEVIRKLSELYCDVAMDPGSLRLDAWVRKGTNRSGSVVFNVGDDITALTHRGGAQARTSAVLGRYADRWVERTGGGERQEAYLELGSASSTAQAQRMIDAAQAERSTAIISTTVGFEPEGRLPGATIRVGDDVSAPNAGLSSAVGRINSLSVSETDDGYDYAVEIGSIEAELVDRLQRLARKTTSGALDGTFENAVPLSAVGGGGDVTGASLTTATPDFALNSLSDVVSIPENPIVEGDFLGWNPDLGMNGMWEPRAVFADIGAGIVPEQEFGLWAAAGVSDRPAAEDHTHGTPYARHPQEGTPYVDFSTGHLQLGCAEGELYAALIATLDVGPYLRLGVASPVGSDGWGRAASEFQGYDDGSAGLYLYNDYSVNGTYGTGGLGMPFQLTVQGALEIQAIEDTPDVSGNGARLYYNESTGTLQISEGGDPYHDIGGGSVEFGVTVAGEQSFGQASDVGDALSVARADHTHGTPLPRHPQTGAPYVDFGSTPGVIALRQEASDDTPALIGTENGIFTLDEVPAGRLFLTSPLRTDGSGRPAVSLVGKTNGNAVLFLYNDLDTAGGYGDPPGNNDPPANPFSVEVEGDLTFRTIANTPPLSTPGQAKLYYRSSLNKMQISENGGAYVDLVGGAAVLLGLGSAVVAEQSFAQVQTAGTATTASRTDHTHGTPNPRHPQTGFPYVDFGTTPGLIALYRDSGDHQPALFATENGVFTPDGVTAGRTFITSQLRTNGSGRPTASLVGKTNGNAVLSLYNDLDTAGGYGDPVGNNDPPSNPFSVELTGDLTTFSIANTPPASPAGSARIYFSSTNGKLMVSENGADYVALVATPGSGVTLGNAIVAEQSFGQVQTAGTATTASRTDHTHGTPLARHPQSGFPYVGFGSAGELLFAARTGQRDPAFIDAESSESFERMFIASATGGNGWGRSSFDLVGHSNGTATMKLFNDLADSQFYGLPGATPNPFMVEIEGTLAFWTIGNVPDPAPPGMARLYFKSSTGKLQLSESGGAYRNIGADLAPGAAGSVLVTNATGTGTRWTTDAEIYVDDATNRVGIGTSAPREQLSVRIPAAGGPDLIATFLGPTGVGDNSIIVGHDKIAGTGLRMGYNSSGGYGFLQVVGPNRYLTFRNNGNIGIGTPTPNAALSFGTLYGNGSGTPAAIHIYDGGTSSRYGIGSMVNEMQFFVPNGTHWSWNAGGDIQASGSNERMRLNATGDTILTIPTATGKYISMGVYLGTTDPVIALSANSAHFMAAGVGSQSGALTLTGAVLSNGQARPVTHLTRDSANTNRAIIQMYNDLKTDGTYGGLNQTLSTRGLVLWVNSGPIGASIPGACGLFIQGHSALSVGIGLKAGNDGAMIHFKESPHGIHFRNQNDSGTVNIYATALNPSSITGKQNVRSMKGSSRQKLMSLQLWQFDRPPNPDENGKPLGRPTTHLGLMAEEVFQHIPEAVALMDGEPYALDFSAITTVLIGSAQEHDTEIERLKKENEALKARVGVLELALA